MSSHHTNPDNPDVRQPPFPQPGTSPEAEHHRHPNTEALLNAAAKHVFPDHPAPPKEEDKDVTREAMHAPREDRSREEQRPLMHGTPLEELQTPMFERSAPSFKGRLGMGGRRDTSDTVRAGGGRGVSTIHEPDDEDEDMDEEDDDEDEEQDRVDQEMMGRSGRPGLEAMRQFGSVRMGTSALVSALNAIPWEGDEDDDSSSDEETFNDSRKQRMAESTRPPAATRPKASRMHSSLHTIRPMATATQVDQAPSELSFPFRANTIARKAQSPGVGEIEYQLSRYPNARSEQSQTVPPPRSIDPWIRRSSADSIGDDARQVLNARSAKEQSLGEEEEKEEIMRAAEEDERVGALDLEPVVSHGGARDINTAAALREDDDDDQPEALRRKEMDDDGSRSGSGTVSRGKPKRSGQSDEKKRIRREKLSDKLMDVFGLEQREEVLEEMRCWLLRSVMLKGYMYLTERHICFFAHMPNKENLVVKTGPLSKKATRTKLNTKFWAVLKNDVLSWYESTADPYFPRGNVSLQYASACEAIEDTQFKLRTAEKNYTFTAENEGSRDEWIRSIQKVMFKTQHEGESVKLIIPLEAILDVEKSPTLEFAETIEIKCVDPDDQMSVDSYFFASFQDNERAFKAIQKRLSERPSSALPRVASQLTIRDDESRPLGSTESRINTAAIPVAPPARVDTGSSQTSGHTSIGKKLGSVLRPFKSKSSTTNDESDTPTLHENKSSSSGFSIPKSLKHIGSKHAHDSQDTLAIDDSAEEDDGYPPRQTGIAPAGLEDQSKHHGPGWGGWIRKPVSKILGSTPSTSSTTRHRRVSTDGLTDTPTRTRNGRGKSESVTEVIEGGDDSDEELGEDRRMSTVSESGGYEVMEGSVSGDNEDKETERKFRKVFAFPDSEELIDHFPGYLYRMLPVSGRFFVSTNYFCFRSSQLLYKTKMIVPIRDLYGLKAQKAFRFGHSGLIVVIKGHEELFLEFSSSKRRKACVTLLEERMEATRLRLSDPNHNEHDSKSDLSLSTRIMEDLDESAPMSTRSTGPPVEPSPLFASTTSTFLEFKPEKMKVCCLTIGSRGDVQPYIALCKGLQAEGHEVRIATHGEYKDWVEGHGIEFASVGGDPAELMAMCVENGMFTVSFLKEGLQKFRGWLDDLLNSSWEACQGVDLLIESPSAMGGIHIAEALRIPYYRAFTMPWTRTRAYPHAFAVPEHKRGGSYNYMTYTMFDQVFWRAISGQINRWRRHTLNIESTNFDKLEQHKVPFLYNFSPNVVPPPLDWTEWVHVTGYWFLENADESAAKDKKWSPSEGLLEFIDKAHNNGKKVVYIGFGSIVVSDPEEMTRCVVDAVVESGCCAILSKGWSDRGGKKDKKEDKEKEGDGGEGKEDKEEKDESGNAKGADGVKYPPEIFSIDSIDHSWLFPRIDAACHHGGAGTSGASLRAGIPTIIKPFFGDQAFWSERVESLNVGSAVRKLDSGHLAEALKKATMDEKQIAKAKIVGEMIRKENGVQKAIEAIYRDLEYAKSLIKPLPSPSSKPLEKVTSLLHPLTSHGDIAGFSLGRISSGSKKTTGGEEGHGSDESWDVVTDSNANSVHEGTAGKEGSGFWSSPDKILGRVKSGEKSGP